MASGARLRPPQSSACPLSANRPSITKLAAKLAGELPKGAVVVHNSHDGSLKMPPALSDDTASSASLGHLEAWAARRRAVASGARLSPTQS